MRRSFFGPVSIASLLLLVILALPAWAQQTVIPAFDSPVVDITGTLDSASKQQLEQQALDLQKRKGSQLQVLMVPSTGPEAIEPYAVRAFEQFKLGRKGVDDGVLLVVAKDDHKVRIEVGYGLEGAIPDITAGRVIQEYLVPKFRQDDYAGGIIDGSAQLVKLIDGESLPEPQSDHANFIDPGQMDKIVFAFFVLLIAAQVMWKKLSRLPKWVRALIVAGVSGAIAWLITSFWVVGVLGAIFGLIVGVVSGANRGRHARSSRWGSSGGGGYSGGSSSSSSGGSDWSGGGGSSGGGGASGSW